MTVRSIRPRALVRHAEALANQRSQAGRAIVTWLRRSTSASYYAVFHGISLAVAAHLAPSCSVEDHRRLARSLEHGKVVEVAKWVSGQGPGKEHVRPIIKLLQLNPDVKRFSSILLTLQQARHEADYDHLADFGKVTTLSHAQQAAVALDLLDGLVRTPDGQRFLALVALNTNLH